MAPLRWSAPVHDIIGHCLAANAVSFSVERRHALVAVKRVHFVIQPLRDIVRLDRSDDSPLGSPAAENWLIWQSLTEQACPTGLPTNPEALADRLGVPPAGADALMVRSALHELVEAVYGRHAL